MIKTSYFANYRKFPEDLDKVSISLYPPQWANIEHQANELTPTKRLLKLRKEEHISDEEYTVIYKREVLSKLNPTDIYNKYKNSILLCYEKDGDFCHRHIISDWLLEAGYDIEESKSKRKIAVVGSRNFSNYGYFKAIMKKFLSNFHEPILVSGGASSGADMFAEKYAKEEGIEILIFPADWDKHGKAAGFIRNKDIWDSSDRGIAFWDGESKGTAHSFDIAKKQKKKLYIVEYNNKKIYMNK